MPIIGQQHSIEKSRQLQRNLYLAANKDKQRRFHALYDRIYRLDILWRAWKEVRANKGSAGIDDITFEMIEEYGVEEYLLDIQEDIQSGKYRPQPVKRVYVPKPDGNRAKTTVSHVSKIIYPGYAFYRSKGKCRFRVHPKSVEKMRNKIRELTKKNNGWGNEYRRLKLKEYIRGWINYFSLADMKQLTTLADEWLRRKIRAIYWKQWKKVKTRYRNLRALELPEWKVHKLVNSRKGYWRMAQVLSCAMTNKIIAQLGYMSMLDYYLEICEN
ncbi:group II intron maturase-specific domain-containing protein [Clostridium sp. Marseille-QA1073]